MHQVCLWAVWDLMCQVLQGVAVRGSPAFAPKMEVSSTDGGVVLFCYGLVL